MTSSNDTDTDLGFGLTPAIAERVAAWLRGRLRPSARMIALGCAFERATQLAFAMGQHANENDKAEAFAHEAAALGCLTALMCEAWGDPSAHASTIGRERQWSVNRAKLRRTFTTKAEALVAALEAAPEAGR